MRSAQPRPSVAGCSASCHSLRRWWRCFRSPNENFVGCFINFYDFFFFLTQFHRSRRADCHQLPWSSSWLPCTPAPPRGSAPGRIHNFTDVPDPCFNRPRAEQPGRRSLPEKKTKRRKLEEISHPWVFSHRCHRRRHHTLFFMPLSHKQS